MIIVKNLSFSYHPDQKLLSGISFSLDKGDFVALLGANGAGKSTILKLILGQYEPQQGSITIAGKNVQQKKDWSDVGYVPQKISIDSNHPTTVKELIKDTSMCSHLKIDHLLNSQFKKLSGGQQQRVLVALALQNKPELLLLDEPTVGVDEQTRKTFYSLLKHLSQKHNTTILIVSHDNQLISAFASKVFCIDDKHHFSEGECVHV